MTKLHELARQGQAVWLDDIRRSYLTEGELAHWVEQGLRGLTSNPTIFEKAIAGSADYDDLLRQQALARKAPAEIFQALAVRDIRQTADILRPVYIQTQGLDGYVSLEVNPALANQTDETIEEATRLFAAVDRPNLMIKIPATPQGIPAIQAVLARGINVNVTLIFSLAQYDAVSQAFMAGLEQYAACGGDVTRLASVASFFVSRVDGLADQQLQAIIDREPDTPRAEQARSLLGKIAIANARLAYGRFQEECASERWQRLAALGAHPQRPLWASTSAKNPAYPDTLYVDELIGPHTVNTLPINTLKAVMDHGKTECSLDQKVGEARRQLMRLAELGISLEAITRKLQEDGVAAFQKSYADLLHSIAQKSWSMLKDEAAVQSGAPAVPGEGEALSLKASLGPYQAAVDTALEEIERQRIVPRIWELDHTVWSPDPAEISSRLGWLRIAGKMQPEVKRMQALADEARRAGYTCALLLGMGGSSLAPEVLRKTFGVKTGYLNLSVLDSTDPAAVLHYARTLDPSRTLFIVSTKSGGTVETFSFFRYFYNWVAATLGADQAGEHFVAITDPGSRLAELAGQHHFRAVFLNDPDIGGRYSALSFFGLAPAALTGLDVGQLLDQAQAMAEQCGPQAAAANNPAVRLGAILGELAKAGRNKLTIITSPAICAFGDWAEQLIAESTGKRDRQGQGRGILPVVGGSVAGPEVYSDDRAFVYLRLAGDHTHDVSLLALEHAGYPAVEIEVCDLPDLGGQFWLWEMATAIAGQRLGIQPFDQPNVDASKLQARKMMAAYQQEGQLPETLPALQEDGVAVYGEVQAHSLAEVWSRFIDQARPGTYITVQAYVPPAEDTDASLLALRNRLRDLTHRAVTTGYGPRFLHSTGQLHKGDGGDGLFIQITADHPQDIAVPDEALDFHSSISFGVLELAQALGDCQALLNAGRKVIRFHLSDDVQVGLARLTYALE